MLTECELSCVFKQTIIQNVLYACRLKCWKKQKSRIWSEKKKEKKQFNTLSRERGENRLLSLFSFIISRARNFYSVHYRMSELELAVFWPPPPIPSAACDCNDFNDDGLVTSGAAKSNILLTVQMSTQLTRSITGNRPIYAESNLYRFGCSQKTGLKPAVSG